MVYSQHADLLTIVSELQQALLYGVDIGIRQIQALKVSAPRRVSERRG